SDASAYILVFIAGAVGLAFAMALSSSGSGSGSGSGSNAGPITIAGAASATVSATTKALNLIAQGTNLNLTTLQTSYLQLGDADNGYLVPPGSESGDLLNISNIGATQISTGGYLHTQLAPASSMKFIWNGSQWLQLNAGFTYVI